MLTRAGRLTLKCVQADFLHEAVANNNMGLVKKLLEAPDNNVFAQDKVPNGTTCLVQP